MRRSFSLKLVAMLVPCLVLIGAHAEAVTVSQNGTQTITAIVPGPPPSTPAVITTPSGNITVNVTPLVIRGTCGPGLIVRVFNNNQLIGTASCQLDGTFVINITLPIGTNVLTALNYDTLDQAGPASPAVIVTVLEPNPTGNQASLPPSKPANSAQNNTPQNELKPETEKPAPGRNKPDQPPFEATISYVKAQWQLVFGFTLTIAGLYLLLAYAHRRKESQGRNIAAKP